MIFPRINGTRKEMTDGKVKVGGAWKRALEVLVKVNGVWKSAWKNVAIYFVCDTVSGSYEYHYDNMGDWSVLENLVVQVYNGSNRLIYTATWDKLETTVGSYSIYNASTFYGSMGIRTIPSENKVVFNVTIDTSKTAARKFIITADKISFK